MAERSSINLLMEILRGSRNFPGGERKIKKKYKRLGFFGAFFIFSCSQIIFSFPFIFSFYLSSVGAIAIKLGLPVS